MNTRITIAIAALAGLLGCSTPETAQTTQSVTPLPPLPDLAPGDELIRPQVCEAQALRASPWIHGRSSPACCRRRLQ